MITTYPVPSVVAALPIGSRARTTALMGVRALRRELLGDCPAIRTLLADRADHVLDEFIERAVDARHDMGWSLHLELGAWSGVTGSVHWHELCVAAARRWVRLDLGTAAWVAIRTHVAPSTAVIGIRSRSLDEGPKVAQARTDNARSHRMFGGSNLVAIYQTGSALDFAPTNGWTGYQPLLRHGTPAGTAESCPMS